MKTYFMFIWNITWTFPYKLLPEFSKALPKVHNHVGSAWSLVYCQVPQFPQNKCVFCQISKFFLQFCKLTEVVQVLCEKRNVMNMQETYQKHHIDRMWFFSSWKLCKNKAESYRILLSFKHGELILHNYYDLQNVSDFYHHPTKICIIL